PPVRGIECGRELRAAATASPIPSREWREADKSAAFFPPELFSLTVTWNFVPARIDRVRRRAPLRRVADLNFGKVDAERFGRAGVAAGLSDDGGGELRGSDRGGHLAPFEALDAGPGGRPLAGGGDAGGATGEHVPEHRRDLRYGGLSAG